MSSSSTPFKLDINLIFYFDENSNIENENNSLKGNDPKVLLHFVFRGSSTNYNINKIKYK